MQYFMKSFDLCNLIHVWVILDDFCYFIKTCYCNILFDFFWSMDSFQIPVGFCRFKVWKNVVKFHCKIRNLSTITRFPMMSQVFENKKCLSLFQPWWMTLRSANWIKNWTLCHQISLKVFSVLIIHSQYYVWLKCY